MTPINPINKNTHQVGGSRNFNRFDCLCKRSIISNCQSRQWCELTKPLIIKLILIVSRAFYVFVYCLNPTYTKVRSASLSTFFFTCNTIVIGKQGGTVRRANSFAPVGVGLYAIHLLNYPPIHLITIYNNLYAHVTFVDRIAGTVCLSCLTLA